MRLLTDPAAFLRFNQKLNSVIVRLCRFDGGEQTQWHLQTVKTQPQRKQSQGQARSEKKRFSMWKSKWKSTWYPWPWRNTVVCTEPHLLKQNEKYGQRLKYIHTRKTNIFTTTLHCHSATLPPFLRIEQHMSPGIEPGVQHFPTTSLSFHQCYQVKIPYFYLSAGLNALTTRAIYSWLSPHPLTSLHTAYKHRQTKLIITFVIKSH